MKRRWMALATAAGMCGAASASAAVIWHPLPPEAYQFGRKYPDAQKLLFAFDYGHALVYERLLLNKGKIADPAKMERQILGEILKILRDPPNVKVHEEDIAPFYVFSFPLLLDLFDWSHLLHQWVYDVLATSSDRGPAMMARVNELFAQYKANAPVAITDQCKTMLFMDGHYFSKSFRRDFPIFNQLIWIYHWFQIVLYEALMKESQSERDLGVQDAVGVFWRKLTKVMDPDCDIDADPECLGFDMMPETAVEAPVFARAFPRLPSAFDNNHMLHDVVSDILTSSRVMGPAIRSEGIRFGRMAMDPEAFKSARCPTP